MRSISVFLPVRSKQSQDGAGAFLSTSRSNITWGSAKLCGQAPQRPIHYTFFLPVCLEPLLIRSHIPRSRPCISGVFVRHILFYLPHPAAYPTCKFVAVTTPLASRQESLALVLQKIFRPVRVEPFLGSSWTRNHTPQTAWELSHHLDTSHLQDVLDRWFPSSRCPPVGRSR